MSSYGILIHMKNLGKLFLVAVFLSFFGIASPVQASAEFSTAFTSTYTVDAEGNAEVLHNIDITNKLAHIYTTKYTLSVGSDRITKIKGLVEGIETPAEVNQSGAATTITIEIRDPVIGYGQTTHLEISYGSQDIASILGNTVTINIPRMSKANEAESFTRIVRLPLDIPPLSSTSPAGYSEKLEGEERVYTFSAHPSESVTMLFGTEVTYKVSLDYEISNPTVSSTDTEIALPPDTAYQQILLDSIDPPPLAIRLDKDGNWLARYTLKAQEKKAIHAVLFTTVTSTPRFFDPSGHAGTLTAQKQYWDTRDTRITDLGKQLKTPRNIYNYVVENFTYNYSRVKVGSDRLGALGALDNPTDTLCTEFTDTFVALARSQGIPAREVNGFAYSQNQSLRPLGLETDILHAWPEYYDKESERWVSVDPTWGNTTGGVNYYDKLDFNHIAFVRHGEESVYPLPAGVYKTEAKTKQIQVTVEPGPERRETSITKGESIVNTGNVALINDQVGYLPPYGEFSPTKNPVVKLSQSKLSMYGGIVVVLTLLGGTVFFLRRKK